MTQRGGKGDGVGGRGKRAGVYVYIQLIHFIVQQKLAEQCKAIYSNLKRKKINQPWKHRSLIFGRQGPFCPPWIPQAMFKMCQEQWRMSSYYCTKSWNWSKWSSMYQPRQWTWTRANSRRWWGTGKLGVLQSMGSRGVRQDLVTEQQQQPTKSPSWK